MTSSGAETGRRVVLDTSAYSRLRAGHEDVLDLVAAAELVQLPATVLGELEAGFRLGRRCEENRIALAEFLAEPFVTDLPVDAAVARRYGALFAELRRLGRPLPVNDIWIAAAAMETASLLLTFDRDFDHVPGLDRLILADTT